jgi:hypothetical protein
MRTPPKLHADLTTRETGEHGATVKILRTAEEVESLREFWSSCPGTLDSDIDSFLSTPAPITESLRLRVFVLYRGGKPLALMAGTIARQRFVFRIGWLRIFKPLVNVLTIHGGLRGDAASENCQELVGMILKCLKNREAHLALLPHVEADSVLFRCVKSQPGFFLRDHFTPLRPHYKRELPDSVEKLYTSLSYNSRSIFRRIAKRLSHEFPGQVRVDRFEAITDLDRTLAVVEEIAKKTWQRAMGGGFHLDRLEACRMQAERGWLRVYTLYLADKPCGFWIGTLYQRTFFTDYTGYDPDYASHSLGIYLLSRMMEELCSEGVEAIDFSIGEEEYKKRFGNVMWRETDLHIFAPSLIGLSLSATKTITGLLHESTKGFLERTSLIPKAKMVWRKVNMKRVKIKELWA